MKTFRRLRRRHLLRAARDLRRDLGPYLRYGSGPFGSSNEITRERQIELLRIKAKLGLSIRVTYWVGVALSAHGWTVRKAQP